MKRFLGLGLVLMGLLLAGNVEAADWIYIGSGIG